MNERLKLTEAVEIHSLTDDERISLLGALGLVDALLYALPDQTDHESDNTWKSIN